MNSELKYNEVYLGIIEVLVLGYGKNCFYVGFYRKIKYSKIINK